MVLIDQHQISDLYQVDGSHNYLLNQPMRNLTQEQLRRLSEQEEQLLEKLSHKTTPREVWMSELSSL
jgi:hypothetical protein